MKAAHPGPLNTQTYVFGSPRVGDANYAAYYNAKVSPSFRVVHYEDIVPHVPTTYEGFHHVAQEIWYNSESDQSFVQCNMSGEDPNCSDSLWFPISTSDHTLYMGYPIGGDGCVGTGPAFIA